jgi:hypothetical protein
LLEIVMLLPEAFHRTGVGIAVAAALIVAPACDNASASCGAAFCMVNTNWNIQGFAPEPGLRLDLRFEYIDQDQPRAGSGKVGVGQIPKHHDEVRTINRNYLATLDYTFNADWGVAVTVPYVNRTHDHIHNHRGAPLPEHWDFRELGDVSVLGRRQWMSENPNGPTISFYGVNFGVKAPTGDFDVRNGEGALAERTLQPGTGTTDLLLGGFFSQVLPAHASSWFAQALLRTPLNSRDDYKPGRRISLDVGYRYEATDRLGLMLQLNALHRSRDKGAQAEPEDTGGKFVFVSPGVSYAFTKGLQGYAFFHKPVYQYVNGVQLTADWSAVAGVTLKF